MPLQISDKTFKRFPLVLNTSLWAYFPRYAINGSCYKSPTVELVSYFEREFSTRSFDRDFDREK